MKKLILIVLFFLMLTPAFIMAQTNQWSTRYVTLDEPGNGTGDRTSSIAVVGPTSFVALVSRIIDNNDIFGTFDNNYLVGYFEADSAVGRVALQEYGPTGQFEVWSSGLDQVLLNGAWQIAGGKNSYVYVANNDAITIFWYSSSPDSEFCQLISVWKRVLKIYLLLMWTLRDMSMWLTTLGPMGKIAN